MDDPSIPGLVAFYLVCLGALFMLVQGISLFFAGLASPQVVLVQSSYSLIVVAITVLQFAALGYSLTESSSDSWYGWFIGNLKYAFGHTLPEDQVQAVRIIGKALISTAFTAVSGSLMIGGATQRARLLPLALFLLLWEIFVYNPIAYWVWNSHGWGFKFGALDYAGGTAVHCTAGFTALVYSYSLGPRMNYPNRLDETPYNFNFVVVGTMLMWFGWLGFNGGALMYPKATSLYSICNTQLSAAAGGITWMLLDFFFNNHWSVISFCSGIVAGLVSVTPGAGYIPIWASVIFGFCGGICCNLGTNVKFRIGIDDPFDIFAVHGIGGLIGSLLTGVFAMSKWYKNPQDHFGLQLARQFICAGTIIVYSTIMSLALLNIIDKIPGCHIRVSPQQEAVGLDLAEHGETVAIGGHDSSQVSLRQPTFNRAMTPNLNAPLYPGILDAPLLKRLPNSYGTLTR